MYCWNNGACLYHVRWLIKQDKTTPRICICCVILVYMAMEIQFRCDNKVIFVTIVIKEAPLCIVQCMFTIFTYIQRKCFLWFQCNCFFMLGLIWLVRENQKNENIIVLAFSLDVHVCNKLCFLLKPVNFYIYATKVSYRVILLKWATNIL